MSEIENAVKKIRQSQVEVFGIGSPAPREYRVRTFQLGREESDKALGDLLNSGWHIGQVTHTFQAVFQVLFWRLKEPETLVAGDQKTLVAEG